MTEKSSKVEKMGLFIFGSSAVIVEVQVRLYSFDYLHFSVLSTPPL
jgi:hypothetical protein